MTLLETKPLKTLQEVEQWQACENDIHAASVSLVKRPVRDPSVPKTLLCHDMRGGYLQDKFPQGSDDDKAYRFYHWQYIDMFIYFSHHFVTIPPPTWTNSAHTHGVQMLGTLITEWDDGLKRCQTFLETEESYKSFADKLVQIANHYGFDGWLVNIENVIQADKVQNLCEFVRYLTSKMHAALPDSVVIWYDSVIATGQLKWQDALNEKNCQFFDVCDGIFLNYNWNDTKLYDSLTLARSKNRDMDVFVGIDVFGRGCLGGGGYNTVEALQAIRRFNMSAAIFAQGWVYETQGEDNFTANENKFWHLLEGLLPRYAVRSLPICSSFCQGYGSGYHLQGKMVGNGHWHDMSLQEVQPCYGQSQFNNNMQQYQPGMGICLDDSYTGGGCLLLEGKLCMDGNPLMFKLYDVCMEPSSEPLFISYTFKMEEPTSQKLQVFLMVEANVENKEKKLILREETSSSDDKNILPCMSQDSIKQFLGSNVPTSENNWTFRSYKLDDLGPVSIKAISFGLQSVGVLEKQSVKLGQIQIMSTKAVQERPILSNLTTTKSDDTMTRLSWKCDKPDLVKYYNIYIRDERECIGHSAVEQYYISEEIKADMKNVSVQAVLCSGFLGSIISL